MLTPREQAVKDRLLQEMDGLSYAEKRRVCDRLDPDSLEEGARIARIQQRRRKWMGLACFLYVVAVTIAMGVKVGRWTPPILILRGLVWVIGCCQQCEWLQRRLLIYQILKLLSDHDAQEAEGPQREAQGTP